MRVDILRHAQSLFNKYRTSEKDCDLSDEGKVQASKVSGDYDVIVLSCLRRTHQTLLYSNLVAHRLLITDLCREKRKDSCDYMPGEDETKGESDEELAIRIDCFKNYLRTNCLPSEKVLVISHRDFILAATGGEKPKNTEMRAWDF